MSISFDLTIDDTRDQLARHARASLEAKPSLIGMSREEMAAALIAAGVPERQVRMRISRSGIGSMYAAFPIRRHAQYSGSARDAGAAFTIARPEVVEEQISQGRHTQMAVPLAAARRWPPRRD